MSLDPTLRERIDTLVSSDRVFLFMKGNPAAPRCGFSARTSEILSSVVPRFGHFDVLADEDVRQAIKDYAQWPTIPQLYVDGEFVGGCDIAVQMFNSGELHRLLGLPEPRRTAPKLSISPTAAQAMRAALDDAPGQSLHLSIDAGFQHQFQLARAEGHEIVASDQGIDVCLDLVSAGRADGLSIDWVETAMGAGLKIDNPNAPPPVAALTVSALKQMLDSGAPPVIVDVRVAAERSQAEIAGSRALELERAVLEALPKETPMAFLCHFGRSSLGVAEYFRARGFTQLYNVDGGIDAWSREVDAKVPRY